MHNAPSVSYPAGRSRWAAALPALAWLAGLACTIGWIAQAGEFGARQAAAVLALLLGGAAAARAWQRSARGRLHWDGQDWHWTPAGAAAAMQVIITAHLDAQRMLLLHARPAGAGHAGHWLWLERTQHPAHWDALRRAVYSRARPRLPQAQPPAATP